MTEAELQEAIRAMCGQLGLYVYHPHDSRRSEKGWPDLAIIGRGGAIFRELKSDTGSLTSEQRQVGYLMRAAGLDWAVWDPTHLADGTVARRLATLAGRRIARV